MTDKTKEALKLALEKIADALPAYIDGVASRDYLATIHKALAEQPAQDEPVAWISTGPARMIHWTSDIPAYGDDWIPLYTSPPAQQEPVKVKTCDTCQFGERCNQWSCKNHSLWKPLQPPQRKPLTDEELWKFWWSRPEVPEGEDDSMEAEFVSAVRAVLSAHGIKEKT